jgi:DNA-directed RNA polymerase subunit K/omega
MPPKKATKSKNKQPIENIPKKKTKGGSRDDESVESNDQLESESESVDDIEFDDPEEEKEDEEEDDEESKGDDDYNFDDNVDDVDDDDCMYRFSAKKKGQSNIISEDEDDGDVEIFFEDDDVNELDEFVSDNNRITRRTLTKYERVRVLGDRAKQISLNAKPMIKNVENLDPKSIARLELENGVLPMIIIRTLPTGKKERWRVNELTIQN